MPRESGPSGACREMGIVPLSRAKHMDDDHRKGVVAVIERDGRWLMIRRAVGIKAAGWWCFPGGGIEPREDPRVALVREIREEVGLDVAVERLLWHWQKPDGSLSLSWWKVRLADADQQPVCNPNEVAEARWVAPTDLRRLEPLLPNNLEFCEAYLDGRLVCE